jgi:hypothetical protein
VSELSDVEKLYLRELRANSTWQSILEKLAEGRQVPAYKPDDTSEERKTNQWIYDSGIDRGRRDVLKRLSDG